MHDFLYVPAAGRRPSDWVERLCSLAASFERGRLVYSQELRPVMINGQKHLAVTPAFLRDHPVGPTVAAFIGGDWRHTEKQAA